MDLYCSKEFQARVAALAGEAGRIALRHYGQVAVELKSNNSVVTAADREVESFLFAHLPSLIPGSVFIGEEMVCEPQSVEAARQAEWLWAVDPIDGTAGIPGWPGSVLRLHRTALPGPAPFGMDVLPGFKSPVQRLARLRGRV
jgi:hypothetical protein